jgi:hypothetical protein
MISDKKRRAIQEETRGIQNDPARLLSPNSDGSLNGGQSPDLLNGFSPPGSPRAAELQKVLSIQMYKFCPRKCRGKICF